VPAFSALRGAAVVKVSRAVAWLSLAVVVAAPLAAWALDRSFGREVQLVAPYSRATVEVNRALWVPGEPVAELYGSPMSQRVRVLVTDERRVFAPREDPTLPILFVGEGLPHPLQAQSVRLAARYAAMAAMVVGSAAVALLLLSAMRLRPAAPAESMRGSSCR
jgi:hypothetical protein